MPQEATHTQILLMIENASGDAKDITLCVRKLTEIS